MSASVIIGLSSQLRFFQGERCNVTLGGGRSIQLSYGDNYEFSLILRGFSRSGQGPGLYSEAISIRRMAFLLMDFRPLKAVFEKLFLFPMLEKRLNHDAIRTKAQIFKNHLARDILFLRRHVLYPTELLRHKKQKLLRAAPSRKVAARDIFILLH